MKKLLVIVLVAVGAWWFFVGGRKLTEEQVNDFYQDVTRATLSRRPEDLCALLAPEFKTTGTVSAAGQQKTESMDKAQTCDGYTKLYAAWDQLGEKMGGTLQLEYGSTIHSITIAPDHKSATVDVSTTLDVGGSIMKIRSRSTDVLIRRAGKVLMLRSDGTGSIAAGS